MNETKRGRTGKMKCKNCGNAILENDSYCTVCGQPIQKKTSAKLPVKMILGVVAVCIIIAVVVIIVFKEKKVEAYKTIEKEEVKIEKNVVQEEMPKEDQIEYTKEEWLYYSTQEGLYRVQPDGYEEEKILNLEINSQWQFVTDKVTREGYIFYTYANTLYRAQADGSDLIPFSEEHLSEWQIITDPITERSWIFGKTQQPFIRSLDGQTQVILPHENIGQVIIYQDEIIYDLLSDPYMGGMSSQSIYKCDWEGKVNIFIEKDQVYQPEESEEYPENSYIYLLGNNKKSIYFGIVSDGYMNVHVFEKNMSKGEIKAVYTAMMPMYPYIGFDQDEQYLYLSYSEVRHSMTMVQLGIEDYEIKGYGAVIGKDENYIYKEQYDGIYKFDRKREQETLIRSIYPMDWYTDYKYHSFVKIDDWIYFDDYDEPPKYEEYENPYDIPTYIYRINVKTGEEESLDESYRALLEDYVYAYQKRQDEKGYSYLIAVDEEESYDIIKIKGQSQERIGLRVNMPIQKLEVVSANTKKSIKMQLDAGSILLKKGEEMPLHYEVQPSDAKLYFVSDNQSVAQVSDEGLIRAHSKGEALLTITAIKEGYKRAVQTVKVTVSENETEENKIQER